MPKPTEFVAHLLDLLVPMGGVSARSMFGGWGFFRQGKMFALVADEVFYVKVDAHSRDRFTALNLHPFSYETKNGRRELTSYYTIPSEALDTAADLEIWAAEGWEAATRAAPSARPTPRKKAPSERILTPRPKKRN